MNDYDLKMQKQFSIMAMETKFSEQSGDGVNSSWHHAFIGLGEQVAGNDFVVNQELHYLNSKHSLAAPPTLLSGEDIMALNLKDGVQDTVIVGEAQMILPRWIHMLHFAAHLKKSPPYFGPGFKTEPHALNCRKMAQETLKVGGISYAFDKVSDAGLEAEFRSSFPRFVRAREDVDITLVENALSNVLQALSLE